MGAHLARRYLADAETEPDPLNMPSFPAQLGLPERRPRGQSRRGPGGRGGEAGGGCPGEGPAPTGRT